MPHSWKRPGRTVLAKSLALLAFTGLLSAIAPKPVSACPLALIIAMDGSSSVDAREHALQLQGLAHALQDPEVIDAISAVGGIWFSSFEWSGRYQQVIQVDWSFLDGEESAKAAAGKLARSRRGFNEFPTALGYALGYAAVHLNKAPEKCARRVIDVAGDGVNNEGFGPASAYDAFPFEGIVVNALAIKGAKPDPVAYYRHRVIRGPGAFVEVASGFDDYAAAMKRKLLREVGTGYYTELQPDKIVQGLR
ncbi:DUF1194 domain-containing protein [uncultured Roseibium sp.]|uniref:DUF1194 domain-containing protein n=1 Tax=uncultured Roseibium sp. TaxID=1936171 RepID=UPI003217322D